MVIKFWRPYGVKNFKLAMFEDQDFSASRDDLDFPAVIRAGINAGWSPLIQVWSRRDGERTYVFARATGKNDVKVLVVTLEQNEAVVVEAKFNPDKLSRAIERWTEDPNSIRRPFAPEPDRAPGDNPVLAQASAEAQAPKPNENKVRAPTAMPSSSGDFRLSASHAVSRKNIKKGKSERMLSFTSQKYGLNPARATRSNWYAGVR